MKGYRLFRAFVLAVFAIAYMPRAVLAQKPGIVEAEKLRQQAEELTDIRSEGSHSFRMTAQVKSSEGKDHAIEGSYELRWKEPTVWRDEIKFNGFSQIRVVMGDRIYISRSTPAEPYEVFKLLQNLEFPNLLRLGNDDKIAKLGQHTQKGERERVIEVETKGFSGGSVFYFDGLKPTLVRVARSDFSHQQKLYSDYMDFHGRLFPRTIAEFAPYMNFEIAIQGIVDADFSDSDLAVMRNSFWLHWCPHPEPAKYIPHSPDIGIGIRISPDQQKFSSGVYGIISTDGRVRSAAVTMSAGQQVDSGAVNKLLEERYIPAKCGGVPVEQELAHYFKYP